MSAVKFGGRLRGLGAVWQNQTAGWLSRSQIKSIQRGTVTIGAGATTATATITSVRTENSVLRFLGYSDSGATVTRTESNCYIELTNGTTVTATHTTAGNSIVASFEVVEYWPGVIRSVQRGLIVFVDTEATKTATITAVDTTKTVLDDLGLAFVSTTTSNASSAVRIALTNATTITATRIGTDLGLTQSYQAVQWY